MENPVPWKMVFILREYLGLDELIVIISKGGS